MPSDHIGAVMRKLLARDQVIGMGYVDLDDGELCLDVTIPVTDDEVAALRELMEEA